MFLDLPECSKEPRQLASLGQFLRAGPREGKASIQGYALEVDSGGPVVWGSVT